MSFQIATLTDSSPTFLIGKYTIPFYEIDKYPSLKYLYSLRSKMSQQKLHITLNKIAVMFGYQPTTSLPAHCFIEWQRFNSDTVTLFLSSLKDNKICGKARLNTYLNAIKKVMERALIMGIISEKQITEIKAIKPYRLDRTQKANILQLDQISSLFQSNGSTGAMRYRDNAILAILFGCGLRRSETLDLNVSSFKKIDNHWFVTVVGKGDKRRTVPMPLSTQPHIEQWLKCLGWSLEDGLNSSNNAQFLFCHVSHRNKIQKMRKLESTNIIYSIIKNRCSEKGLPACSPHDARRTVATILYNVLKIKIEIIQDILGHASIDTTKAYIYTESKQYSEAVAGLNF